MVPAGPCHLIWKNMGVSHPVKGTVSWCEEEDVSSSSLGTGKCLLFVTCTDHSEWGQTHPGNSCLLNGTPYF